MLAAGDLALGTMASFREETFNAFLAYKLGAVVSVEVMRRNVTVEDCLLAAVLHVCWEPVVFAFDASLLSWAACTMLESKVRGVARSASSELCVPEIAFFAFWTHVVFFVVLVFLNPEIGRLAFKFDFASVELVDTVRSIWA